MNINSKGQIKSKVRAARKHMKNGNFRAALSELQPLMSGRNSPIATAEPRLLMADCFIALNSPQQAAECLALLKGKTQGEFELARSSKMGLVLLRLGQAAAACEEFASALALAPKDPSLAVNAAAALLAAGKTAAAIDKLKAWIEMPDFEAQSFALRTEAFNLLGNAKRIQGEIDLALEYLETAKSFCAEREAPFSLLGNLALSYWEIGETESALEAAHAGRKAMERQGGSSYRLAWLEAISHIVAIPDTASKAETSKKNWSVALKTLESEVSQVVASGDSAAQMQLLSGACTAMPFFLGYLGGIDLALHKQHGEALNHLMQAAIPLPKPNIFKLDSSSHSAKPNSKMGAKLGIVTAYLRPHSVWKIPIHGWLSALAESSGAESSGAEISGCVHVLTTPDSDYVAKVRSFGWTVKVHTNGTLEAAAAIHRCNYDMLLYPEVGMDSETWRLAALRLSRHQAFGLGHPVTTGLPTMDTVLSSDLMEVPEAQDHYCETLVRIPDLGSPYLEPPPLPSQKTKADFGLDTCRPTLLSCQSVFKYQPQDDSLYAEIARSVPDAQIVFLNHNSKRVMKRFKARLSACFQEAGLKMEAHCYFLPQCRSEDFAALNACSDLFLDAPGWSGFNSSMEATRLGLPVVTLPGYACRTRHALAVLKFFGLEDGIAESREDYISRVKAYVERPQSQEGRKKAIKIAESKLEAERAGGDAARAFRNWCLNQASQ